MAQKLAFIGLGVMGFPMAGHLQQAGYDVCVYNRTTAKAEDWQSTYGGRTAPSPDAAAEGADIVFCCVGNDDDLREVTTGKDGAFHGMRQGALFVDHTTASARIAQELAAHAHGMQLRFMDAPVSGGQAGAENGKLTIMAGGTVEDYTEAEPVMAAYHQQCVHMGPVGTGQITKMCNQVAIAGVVQGLAESLHLAESAGLDVKKAIQVMQKGSAGSWFMDNRAHTMHERAFDFGFSIDWMRKDLGIALDAAQAHQARLPVTALIDQFFGDVQQAGGQRQDVSALITRFNHKD